MDWLTACDASHGNQSYLLEYHEELKITKQFINKKKKRQKLA